VLRARLCKFSSRISGGSRAGKTWEKRQAEDDRLDPRLAPEVGSRLTRRRVDPRLNYDNASAWRAPGALVEFPLGKLRLLALARVIIGKHGAARLQDAFGAPVQV